MVKGVANFQRKMRAIPLRVRLEIVKQLEKEADKLVKEMRRLAPVGTTAKLMNSIGWTWGEAPKGAVTVGKVANNEFDRIAITIYAGGGDAFYAKFQEFGTVKMAANPFFFPVYRANRSRMRANIKRAVKRGFQKASQ